MQMSDFNVLHCFNEYLPITQNWAYNLINSLDNKRVKNTIVAINYLDNNFYNEKFDFVHYPLKTISFNDKYQRNLILRKVINQLFMLIQKKSQTRWVSYYLKKSNISIIHAHFSIVGWRFKMLKMYFNVPFIISFYGYDYESLIYKDPTWRCRYTKLFNLGNAFICEGSHGARTLISLGCPAEKIHVIPLGVNVRSIPFVKREKIVNNLKLLQIASFREKKGHIHTVRAFANALETMPSMTLTFVGSGELKDRIVKEVENLDIREKVVFIDSLLPKQMYELMSENDVFIHPSCYSGDRDCEGGAPIVILDAQATGMPIISTLHCDIPDEVLADVTGKLVEEKNEEQISNAIKFFYKLGNGSYQKFSIKAREHVENNYDVINNSKKLEELYYSFY